MTGLVMEGGGMRGLFTSGIIDTWLQNGVTFPCAVGVSAGACFGVNFKSEQWGRALRYNVQMVGNKEYMSVQSMLKTGEYINSNYCYHVVPTQIDIFDNDTFRRNPMDFWLVCTDIQSGDPVYHKLQSVDYEGLEWIRASASLPIVSKPVQLEGKRLMDGGLSDSIPLRFIEGLGYEKNVVILTQPLGYRKKAMSGVWLYRMLYPRYPKLAQLLSRRHEMYNEELHYVELQSERGKVLIIAPPEPLAIGRVEQNPERMTAITQLGRDLGLQTLEKVREFLA